MIRVGQWVSFVPVYQKEIKPGKRIELRPEPVVGRVFKINENGVVFVEYESGGVLLRESFLLCDLGKAFNIVRE